LRKTTIVLTLIIGGCLAACAQKQAATDGSLAQPAAAQLQPTPGLASGERLQLAIKSLQFGEVARARVELQTFLAGQPKNKVASSLLAQIDTPIETYFPRDSFPVSLKQGESLSTLSATYLGDPLQFYALARYNQIQNPSKVTVGQSVRMPKTPTAVAAAAKAPATAAAATPVIASGATAGVPAVEALSAPAPAQDDPRRAASQGR
jgi:hypothetical protein